MAGTTVSATNMQNTPLQRRYGMMPTASMQQVSATGGRYNPEAQNAILQREMENNKMRSVDVRTQALQRQAMEQEAATRAEELRLAALEQEREAALQKLTVETEANRLAGQKTLEDAYLKQGQNDLNVSAARREYAQNKYLADIQSREDMMETANQKRLINSGLGVTKSLLGAFGKDIGKGLDELITPTTGEVPSGGGATITEQPTPTVSAQPAATEEVVPAGGVEGQVEAAPTTAAVQDTAQTENITNSDTQQMKGAALKLDAANTNLYDTTNKFNETAGNLTKANEQYFTSSGNADTSFKYADELRTDIETLLQPLEGYYNEAMKYKGYAEGAQDENGYNWAVAKFNGNVRKMQDIENQYNSILPSYTDAVSKYDNAYTMANNDWGKADTLYQDVVGQQGYIADTVIPEFEKRYDVAGQRGGELIDSSLGIQGAPNMADTQAKSYWNMPSAGKVFNSGLSGVMGTYQGLNTLLNPESSDLRKLGGGIQTLGGLNNLAQAAGVNTGSLGNAIGTAGSVIGVGTGLYDLIAGKTTADKIRGGVNLTMAGVQAAPYALNALGYTGASTALGSGLSAIAGPAAIVGAAELARGFWGGQGIPWSEKTKSQKANDSPATFGVFAQAVPGALLDSESSVSNRAYKGMSAAERLALAPIDAFFSGDLYSSEGLARADAMRRENMKVFNEISRRPFGDDGEGGPSSNDLENALNFVANPIQGTWDNLGSAGPFSGDSDAGRAGNVGLAVFTGGLSSLFCFAKGTPILMENGDTIPVEQVRIFNKCMKGGTVTAIGEALSDEIYDYEGVEVTGSHAVYENRKWIRVRDSEKSIKVDITAPQRVYIINNMNHALVVNGIIFADYGEVTDSENMTAQDRLEYMNAHSKF